MTTPGFGSCFAAKELLAELVVTGGDFPWLNARPLPRRGFEDVRPLSEEELRVRDHIDYDVDAWEAAYQDVRQAVRLRARDGRLVSEFLHSQGDDA